MRSQLHAGFGAFGITCGANKPVGSGGNGGAATACAPSSAALTHLAPSHSMDTLTAQVKRAIFDEPTLHSARMLRTGVQPGSRKAAELPTSANANTHTVPY